MTGCQRHGFLCPCFNLETAASSFSVYTQWFLVDIYCNMIAIASSHTSYLIANNLRSRWNVVRKLTNYSAGHSNETQTSRNKIQSNLVIFNFEFATGCGPICVSFDSQNKRLLFSFSANTKSFP